MVINYIICLIHKEIFEIKDFSWNALKSYWVSYKIDKTTAFKPHLMADYSSDIVVNSFLINFNHKSVICMKTHSNEC